MTQRKQLPTVPTVNGNGMDFADFVWRTFLRTDKGLANMIMQKMTATFPIKFALPAGLATATRKVARTSATTPCKCCFTVPGRVGVVANKIESALFLGMYRVNSQQYQIANASPIPLHDHTLASFFRTPGIYIIRSKKTVCWSNCLIKRSGMSFGNSRHLFLPECIV